MSTEVAITWHGHSNFQISSRDVNILIDPFFENNPSVIGHWETIAPPHLVLITHDHDDHVGDAIRICKKYNALLGCVVGTAQSLVNQGLPQKLLLNDIGFNIGGTVDCRSANITMTQAFHSSNSGVPVGYVITMPGGLRLYHAGDTGVFSSMQLIGQLYSVDIAMLPIGGVFTMCPEQAALAAKLLNCKTVIPMHWGTFSVLEQNTDNFVKQLARYAPSCKLCTLKPGETYTP